MLFMELAKVVLEWHQGWTEALEGGTMVFVSANADS